jgi:Co/Zn/Cd efflux system component
VLIFFAMAWSMRSRARVGMLLAAVLMVRASRHSVPRSANSSILRLLSPSPSSLSGLGALVVNMACAYMLAVYRHHRGSLTRAAFLLARNDVLANIAITAAGFVTAFVWQSAWPDLIVGLAIAAMHADAAREVWSAAREEHRSHARP